MDVREKLVELVKRAITDWKHGDVSEMIADHLIANGVTVQENVKISDEFLKQLKNAPIMICKSEPSIVTVQEWIPASEPPKKITNKVIVLCKNGYRGFGHYEDYKGKQTWYNLESGKPFTDWDLEDCESYEVTHWQPLPQPPKGE